MPVGQSAPPARFRGALSLSDRKLTVWKRSVLCCVQYVHCVVHLSLPNLMAGCFRHPERKPHTLLQSLFWTLHVNLGALKQCEPQFPPHGASGRGEESRGNVQAPPPEQDTC